jgi:Tol biopolymer transport system component
LWSITPEGAELTRVTAIDGNEYFPCFSPVAGADVLAFSNFDAESGTYTICTHTPGEGEPRAVKGFNKWIENLAWSQDGEWILFCKFQEDGIFKISVDGGEVIEVPRPNGWFYYAVVALQANPTSGEITFIQRELEGSNYIYSLNSINIEGGEPIRIHTFEEDTHFGADCLTSSLDGSKIVYTAFIGGLDSENIFLIPHSGGDPLMLTEYEHWARARPTYPIWSASNNELFIRLDLEAPNTYGIYSVKLKP